MPTESVSYRLRTRDLTYVALCAVLIAVCAWISIPAPVPFTLQTFGIFAALTLLGGRRGCYAVAVYLLLGLVGLRTLLLTRGGVRLDARLPGTPAEGCRLRVVFRAWRGSELMEERVLESAV